MITNASGQKCSPGALARELIIKALDSVQDHVWVDGYLKGADINLIPSERERVMTRVDNMVDRIHRNQLKERRG